MITTDEEKRLLKDAVLEDRRFSDAEVVNETRQQAAINIELMYKFLNQSLRDQLRYLCISIRTYINKNKNKAEKLEIAEKYLLTELSRLFNEARKSGNIVMELGLQRYGRDVMNAGNKLNRIIRISNKEEQTKGYLSKINQLKISKVFSELVNAFKTTLFGDKELPDDTTVISEMITKKQSDISSASEQIYYFDDVNSKDKLDIMKRFKQYVSLSKCKFISIGASLEVHVSSIDESADSSLREIEMEYKETTPSSLTKSFSLEVDPESVSPISVVDLDDEDVEVLDKYKLNDPSVVVSPDDELVNIIKNKGKLVSETKHHSWYQLPNNKYVGVNDDAILLTLN